MWSNASSRYFARDAATQFDVHGRAVRRDRRAERPRRERVVPFLAAEHFEQFDEFARELGEQPVEVAVGAHRGREEQRAVYPPLCWNT